MMRLCALLGAGGLLAACATGPVTVPSDRILYEVPQASLAPAAPPGAAITPAPAGGGLAGGSRSAPLTPGAVPVPQSAVQAAQAGDQDDFTRRIEQALDGGGILPATPQVTGSPLDDDRLNLNEYTLEQQRIDAAIAERQLEAARRQLVIVQPEMTVPQSVEGANIVLFAKQTSHQVGERRYSRPVTAALNRGGACRRFSSDDEAQRFFLANGGPERDPYGLDPDGDGFACGWNPEPFRRLGL